MYEITFTMSSNFLMAYMFMANFQTKASVFLDNLLNLSSYSTEVINYSQSLQTTYTYIISIKSDISL